MKNYIFDTYSHLPEEIDPSTIQTVENFNTENVRSIVMKEIQNKNQKTKKTRNFKKHTGIILIAAALGVAALGTIGAGAMGSFNSDFAEHFAGQKINGVYPGGNIQISTDKNYHAELVGVAGDKENAMAAVSFTKADGTPFADPTQAENIYITNYSNDPAIDLGTVDGVLYEFNSDNYLQTEETISISTSEWAKMKMNLYHDSAADTPYSSFYLAPDGSIKATYLCNRTYMMNNGGFGNEHNYSLSGETMTINNQDLYIYHDEKMIFEKDLNLLFTNPEAVEEFNQANEEAKEAVLAVKDQLTDGKIIRRHITRNYSHEADAEHGYVTVKFYISTYEKINLDFNGSWKLNYKTNDSVSLQPTDQTLNFDNVEFTVNSIDSQAFEASIQLSFSETPSQEWLEKFEKTNNIIITLKDGTKLTGMWGWNNVLTDNTVTMNLLYCRYDANSLYSDVWTYVDAEQIASIQIYGNEYIK